MIPTQQLIGLSITDLPARAIDASLEDSLNLLGGQQRYWRCCQDGTLTDEGTVYIHWGFKSTDAEWACRTRIRRCSPKVKTSSGASLRCFAKPRNQSC